MSLEPDYKMLLSPQALYELEKVNHTTITTDYANYKHVTYFTYCIWHIE